MIVLTKDMDAYDEKTGTERVGVFLKDSLLGIMGSPTTSGMYLVEYRDSNGKVINALCQKTEIDPYLGVTSGSGTSGNPTLAPHQWKNTTASARAPAAAPARKGE